MTNYYKEQREKAFKRDSYICVVCQKPATQTAHVICKSKVNYKKWSRRFIDHHSNLRSVCCLACNAEVMISDVKTKQIEEQLKYIKRSMENENTKKV